MMAVDSGPKKFVSLTLAVQLLFTFIPSSSPRVLPASPKHGEAQKNFKSHAVELAAPNLGAITASDGVPSFVPAVPGSGSNGGSYRPDTYIVTLADNVTVSNFLANLTAAYGPMTDDSLDQNHVGYVYDDDTLHGFSARLNAQTLQYVYSSDYVVEVLPDTLMSILPISEPVINDAPETETASQSSRDTADDGFVVQSGTAGWNLQRISQRKKITSNGKNPSALTYDYTYKQKAGQGIVVYVLDTGARATHDDFEGRVQMAAQFGGYQLNDGNGHGTHCAGVITGKRWGVSKQVRVRAVKVLSDQGTGSSSDVIAGVQYVIDQYRKSGKAPTVASLSLGGGRNAALDRVVQSAINMGIHFVVAAGNSNEDACSASPAAVSGATVVAASDIADSRAPYSNWGTCVDVFAPGSSITAAWFKDDQSTAKISGTSMATPQVAAMIANLLSERNMTPAEMSTLLKENASQKMISMGPGGSGPASTPNYLVYNMAK